MSTVAEKNETSVQTQPVDTAENYVVPGVNILETKDGYLLEAELPGVSKDGLSVSVEDNILTLVGRRPATPEASALYRESEPGNYRRTFELDPSIDVANITARIEQGVLSVTLPKVEKAKAHQIAVN
jgi:HSP20 family protein